MSSKIKSISLDDTTDKIAAHIQSNGGNFSAFVRECLIRYHAQTGGAMMCRRGTELSKHHPPDRLCRPYLPNRCIKCWPVGEPTREAWADYTHGPERTETRKRTHSNLPDNPAGTAKFLTDPDDPMFPGWYAAGEKYEVVTYAEHEHFNDHVWIQAEAERINPPLFDLTELNIKGNAKPAKTTRPRHRRSLIRWLLTHVARWR